MGFWKKVEDELEYRGMSRKELSILSSINEATIHKAIERDSEVSVNTALKIANALHIPLESLLDDFDSKTDDSMDISETIKRESILLKYWSVYEDLEKIPLETRQILIDHIHRFANI